MISKQLTIDQYNAKVKQLWDEQGITLVGYAGKVSKLGVTIQYNYDGTTLNCDVLSAPPFMKGHVESELNKWLTS